MIGLVLWIPDHAGPTDLVIHLKPLFYSHAAPLALRNGWSPHIHEILWIWGNSPEGP